MDFWQWLFSLFGLAPEGAAPAVQAAPAQPVVAQLAAPAPTPAPAQSGGGGAVADAAKLAATAAAAAKAGGVLATLSGSVAGVLAPAAAEVAAPAAAVAAAPVVAAPAAVAPVTGAAAPAAGAGAVALAAPAATVAILAFIGWNFSQILGADYGTEIPPDYQDNAGRRIDPNAYQAVHSYGPDVGGWAYVPKSLLGSGRKVKKNGLTYLYYDSGITLTFGPVNPQFPALDLYNWVPPGSIVVRAMPDAPWDPYSGGSPGHYEWQDGGLGQGSWLWISDAPASSSYA